MALPHFTNIHNYTREQNYTIDQIVKTIKYYIGIEPAFYSPINNRPVYNRHVDITKEYFRFYEHSNSFIEIIDIINDDMIELKQKIRNKKLNSLI